MQKSSSASGIGISRTTTSSASFSHTQEYGDELESYLTLLAAGNSEKTNNPEVDWGKVLDKQYEEQTSTEVDGESESSVKNEYNDIQTNVTQFLKPPLTEAAKNSSSKHDITENTELQLNSSHLHVAGTAKSVDVDPSYSLTNTDSYTEFNDTKPGPFSDATATFVNAPSLNHKPDSNLERKKLKSLSTKTTLQPTKSQRVTSVDEDTSDDTSLSLSQDLGLSSHFKNSIFTVDQLGPIDADSDCNSVTENDKLYNVISLADIDSPAHKDKTDLLQDSELQGYPHISEVEAESNEVEAESNDERSLVSHHETTSIHYSEEGPPIIQESTSSVNYEDDFETEPTHSDNSVQGSNSPPNDNDDITRSQVRDTLDSDSSESGNEYSNCSSTQCLDQINPRVVQHSSSHQLTQDAANLNDNGDLVHRTETKDSTEQYIHKLKENVRDPASEVHSSGFNQNGHPLQTEPDLSYFHSIPHIPQLHPTLSATGVPSLVSETLKDLLHCQLALTRALVTHSRSLAQHLSDSITPNYHYTTLEDTKKYISQHRPKVLSTEEARQLVSQEDM